MSAEVMTVPLGWPLASRPGVLFATRRRTHRLSWSNPYEIVFPSASRDWILQSLAFTSTLVENPRPSVTITGFPRASYRVSVVAFSAGGECLFHT
jgi:hypothetical protein